MRLNNIYKVALGFLVIILFSGFFEGKSDLYFEISKNIDLFGKVYKEVTFNYVDKVNPEQFMRAGIKGMLNTLDPYTVFIDNNEQNDIDLITNGKYGGIGISIGIKGNNVTIVDVMDGYSAQKQGLRVGDVLFTVSGKRITPQNIDDVSSLVKGDPGTMVHLQVLRNDAKDTLSFNLVREEVAVKSLAYYGFYPENSNNAYLRLTSFSRSAGDEVKNALTDLKKKKEIKSVVLDLRGNPGGLLDVAVDICDKFLPKGDVVVTTKGRDKASTKSYYASQQPMLGKARLVILINGGSASASEIVSGAIQDHDRGILLGTKSFGKGLVQTITPLDYNTSLKITTAKYFTPSGRCIQKIDYAKDNAALSEIDTVIKNSYYTDHKRKVYSAGGITPDSIVKVVKEGDITKDFLAKGMFFQFADHFYYKNPKADFAKLKDENLLNEFEKFLKEKDYKFSSSEEKQVKNLIADIKSKNLGDGLIAGLQTIDDQLSKLGENEMKIYKDQIISEIKTELASRYLGLDGEIREALKYDNQFQTAMRILADTSEYDRILNTK